MKVLLTCPPMIGMLEAFRPLFRERGLEVDAAETVQTLSEAELIKRVPEYDGWILGDDPATRAVFEAGREGRLRAAVKWGIGVDNVDFQAALDCGIPVTNTPQMFGGEVADTALGYLIALARDLLAVDRGVRSGGWPKPRGSSLAGKTAALVGFGDIGRQLARRLLCLDMNVIAYDPRFEPEADSALRVVESAVWPARLGEADALLFVCALTADNRHMLDGAITPLLKRGVWVVNVSRGPLIEQKALASALASGRVHSAALDVFEVEPLPPDSPLRGFGERVIFGSHNASNTEEAVVRASREAVDRLCALLESGGGP